MTCRSSFNTNRLSKEGIKWDKRNDYRRFFLRVLEKRVSAARIEENYLRLYCCVRYHTNTLRIEAYDFTSREIFGVLTTYDERYTDLDLVLVKHYSENQDWSYEVTRSDFWKENFDFVTDDSVGPYNAPISVWRLKYNNVS